MGYIALSDGIPSNHTCLNSLPLYDGDNTLPDMYYIENQSIPWMQEFSKNYGPLVLDDMAKFPGVRGIVDIEAQKEAFEEGSPTVFFDDQTAGEVRAHWAHWNCIVPRAFGENIQCQETAGIIKELIDAGIRPYIALLLGMITKPYGSSLHLSGFGDQSPFNSSNAFRELQRMSYRYLGCSGIGNYQDRTSTLEESVNYWGDASMHSVPLHGLSGEYSNLIESLSLTLRKTKLPERYFPEETVILNKGLLGIYISISNLMQTHCNLVADDFEPIKV